MKAHARFFFLILICALTLFSVAIASAEAAGVKPFSTDYEAINEAAQSMFLVEVYDRNDTLIKTGSGFIAFDEHYFVTNHHVIEDAQYLIVVDDNGKEYKVTDLLVADEEKDIAILSFDEAANYRPLPLCADDNLLRGQPIVAIGSPKGVRNTVTTGNISNLIDDNGTHIIQFTAAASPGSSGGAIFNDRGEVIGLMFSKRTDAENMNYAIFIEEVADLKTINTSLTSLSDFNLSLAETLVIKNTSFDIDTIIPSTNTSAELYIKFQNNKTTKTIASVELKYSYSQYVVKHLADGYSGYLETLVIPNIKLGPEKTVDIMTSISQFNYNASHIYIGVSSITFDDGTKLAVSIPDVLFYEIKVNQKKTIKPTLVIPSGSLAEWDQIGNEPIRIKIRIQLSNKSNDYDIAGYKLYFSDYDLTINTENPYYNELNYTLNLNEQYFNTSIQKGKTEYSGYFILKGKGAIPKDLYVGIKQVKLSDGTNIIFDDEQIVYSHWILK